MARAIRDGQWRFMERIAEHGTLWFTPWNKSRREEAADELREGLIGGMELLDWVERHKDWFESGEWSSERDARPYRLTDAGRAALADRATYDMEPVYGGLVEPGWRAIPSPPGAT